MKLGKKPPTGQLMRQQRGRETWQITALAATGRAFEPSDNTAGVYDKVSAAYQACWWRSRGVRIVRKVGDTVLWSDRTQQAIEHTLYS